ncbi:hypothetical protein AB0I60_04885 [Actinosynnema sp. NPDC050436]
MAWPAGETNDGITANSHTPAGSDHSDTHRPMVVRSTFGVTAGLSWV